MHENGNHAPIRTVNSLKRTRCLLDTKWCFHNGNRDALHFSMCLDDANMSQYLTIRLTTPALKNLSDLGVSELPPHGDWVILGEIASVLERKKKKEIKRVNAVIRQGWENVSKTQLVRKGSIEYEIGFPTAHQHLHMLQQLQQNKDKNGAPEMLYSPTIFCQK